MQTTLTPRDAATLRDRVARAQLGLPSPSDTQRGRRQPATAGAQPTETETGSAVGKAATSSPIGQYGDVDANGDIVDELQTQAVYAGLQAAADRAQLPDGPAKPQIQPASQGVLTRRQRLAAAITACTAELAAQHLANILHALERVPS